MNRQPNVQQQQPNVVPAHPSNATGTQPLLATNNVMVQSVRFVNFNNAQPYYSGYGQQIPYGYYPVQAHPQSTDTSGYAIPINPIPSNSHMQNHRPPPHQQLSQTIAMAPPNMNHSFMIPHMQQRPKDQTANKRQRNPLAIVNPKTNEVVNVEAIDRNSSGTNTHSSALKIEAPSPAHNQSESQSTQPPNSRKMPSAQSTSDGSAILLAASNEPEQTTCKCPIGPHSFLIFCQCLIDLSIELNIFYFGHPSFR